MLPIQSMIPRRLILTAVLVLLLIFVAALPAWGQEANYSVRYAVDNSFDFEMFLGNLGVLINYNPDHSNASGTDGAGAKCTASFSRTTAGLRYFFGGPQDNFYLGAGFHTDAVDTATNCTPNNDTSGLGLLLGYHWMWGNGFNIDLGFRPGTLALGFSF